MQIESIKPGRRDKSKLIIHFTDGSYAETSAEDSYMLKVGQELTCEAVNELSERYRKYKAKKSAANSLSHRSMSEKELIKKLHSRGYSDEEAESAATWLRDIGVLNDENYAKSCASYYKARGYGSIRIREELMRRGIPREMTQEVLSELPDTAEELDRLIEKKLGGIAPDEDRKRRLVAMLMRRGFRYDEIRAAFSRLAFDVEDML